MPLLGNLGRWKSLASGDFHPLDLNPEAWYAARLLTGFSDGDLVESWTDQSGNGHHATQATSELRAVYKTNIINGRPVMRFAGDGYSLITPFYPTSGWTAFHVLKKNTGGGRLAMLTSNSILPYTLMGHSNARVYTSNRVRAVSRADGATSFALWTTKNTSGNVLSMYKNGVSQSTTNSTASSTGDFNGLGYRGYNNTYSTGDIAEVFVCPSSLSDTDREAMEQYLMDLYAL